MRERMMAHVVRPFRTQQQCCTRPTFLHHLLPPLLLSTKTTSQQHLSFSTLPISDRLISFRSNALRSISSDLQENSIDSESLEKKSRNEKKREARRAVKWGMELATFSTPRIKQILRVASLEREVFDALMLVKRLGPDVREGKRRQFNYIGRLLRKAQPELMDTLIQASKDGDQAKLQALSGTESLIVGEDEEDGGEIEYEEDEKEEEGCHNYNVVATRWFEGLIDKDSDITNEIYSIHRVEFDRQELRKLVRTVHSMQDRQLTEENGQDEAALAGAKKSLISFLRSVAKQRPNE